MTRSRHTLRGWGNLPAPGREVRSENLEALTDAMPLSRGLGRSYGDSSLPAPGDEVVAGTTLADRILSWDEDTGLLRVEAGLSLAEIVRVFLPRGWFVPVTPGTKFVTVGGMVASDVHGKNHHVAGCFGEHVVAMKLRVGAGRIVACSAEQHPDLFLATIGGMGLTGHILEVAFRMVRVPSPWIWMESRRVPDIDAYIAGLDDAARTWPFTMGWIDCVSRGRNLGRGILMAGRWARRDEAPGRFPQPLRRLAVPFDLPGWAVNRVTSRLFNGAYYWKHLPRERRGIVHPDVFFYPLDAIHDWNRGYGKRGFTQYQCVLPRSAGPGAAREFLELLVRSGGASPLCVIKDCGAEGRGTLSFPMPGISIAVDLAITPGIQALVDQLNELVIARGGRIYLTKDAFTRPEHFRAMEPRLDAFLEVCRRWDPHGRLRSKQSVRIFGRPRRAVLQAVP